jgi:hypothetical protein
MWAGGYDLYRAIRALLSGQWPEIREQALERDNHSCQNCGRHRNELNQEPDVHHIIPLLAGGTHGDWNLLSLCRSCHSRADALVTRLSEHPFADFTDDELPDGRMSSREYMARVADPSAGQATFAAFVDD